jgi:hypothetical protein
VSELGLNSRSLRRGARRLYSVEPRRVAAAGPRG